MTVPPAPAVRSVRAAGDAALLVEAGAGPPVPARLAAVIKTTLAEQYPDISDVIPGARTVLIVTEPGCCDLAALARRIRALASPDPPDLTGPAAATEDVAEIPVHYDGPDLADVAELAGLTAEEVIAKHSGRDYVVGWLGFSPGFAYLTGLDPALHVPRLPSPRTTVPAGSVAIAGPLAAVYPSSSPGGWRLLGRTPMRLWDPSGDPPAALAPGMRVKFRPVEAPDKDSEESHGTGSRGEYGSGESGGHESGRGPGPGRPPERAVEVVRPGPLAIVQDLGRPGYGHLGVPRSGAADTASLRLANRLVGNPEDAAAVELMFGGAALRFRAAAWVAVTGAPAAVHVGSGRDESGMGVPFAVPAGALLTVSAPVSGLRSYLAVRGGIDVPPVLGSRSSDTLSGLGPAPLRPGDVLPLGGTSACGPIVADIAPPAGSAAAPATEAARLRVVAGPRDDWFTAGALDILGTAEYRVSDKSDRSGLRLSGPVLPRDREDELPSEGMVAGALQVPPDGQPILFLADHPVTGGYPVIAVVVSADAGRAAQLRPGDRLRFRPVPSPLS
jgi:KipI family sensor histidine kinase inhibitor